MGTPRRRLFGRNGFTLIELLVVVSIMVLVALFVAPAVVGVFRGSNLTQAAQLVSGQLDLARQSAITQNHTVEVFFYQYADPSVPGQNTANSNTWTFQAVQSFVISDTGAVSPLGKVETLPSGIIMDSGPTLSSLFDPAKRTYSTNPTTALPRAGKNYAYFSMRFYPNGSTDLSPTINGVNEPWCLTLHSAQSGDKLAVAPANFWTILIDPINGGLAGFHP
jgi:uncharacterized protein (TIGR02596 family)